MRERFIDKAFSSAHSQLIATANGIIGEYQGMGFTLTLRQLYYQFVARGVIANKQTEYKRLGGIINDARLAGRIDWDAIEDRTRTVEKPNAWQSPESILSAVASQYREDIWEDQPRYVQVRIEKEALVGVIEPVCDRWRVPYLACRGYVSQSVQYSDAKLMEWMARQGRRPLILYLGDHDPSGMDMTRDNRERTSMFARRDVEVIRLALNMDQIEEYDPPPNPAKETDSRSGPYIEEYGESSWELDALDPPVIDKLIDDAISEVIDFGAWNASLRHEAEKRATLTSISDNFDNVEDHLRESGLIVLPDEDDEPEE